MLLALANCGGNASDEGAAAPVAKSAPAPAPAATAATTPVNTPTGAGAPREILGVLSVEHEVDVLAQRDGAVMAVNAEEGAARPKGAILAQLDDRSIVAQLEKAKADTRVAESNVKYNEAELKATQARLRRAEEMHKAGLNSQADLEEAEFKAKGSAFDLESWKAAVDRNRSEVRVLELELDKTHIRAPFQGVVARRYIREGQNVLKDEKCFRLSQLGPLLVRFQVPEASARRPVVGERVHVEMANDSRRSFQARIRRVSPNVDAASGTYDVTAELAGAGRDLRPGMAVRIEWSEARGGKMLNP
jgi:membrane fusion protein (multidrug efflux system)